MTSWHQTTYVAAQNGELTFCLNKISNSYFDTNPAQIICVIEESSCGAVNQWTQRNVDESSQDPNYLDSITIYLFQF